MMQRTTISRFLLFAVAIFCLVGCQHDRSDDLPQHSGRIAKTEDDAKSIRALIPEAAGMRLSDLRALAEGIGEPKESDVADKSLTLIMLTLVVSPSDSKANLEEFNYLSKGYPDPSKIADLLDSSRFESKSRGTLVLSITDERITGFSCTVDNDVATGTVSYKLPELLSGSVKYVAQKNEGQWKITELSMPTRGINLRFENNSWKRKP